MVSFSVYVSLFSAPEVALCVQNNADRNIKFHVNNSIKLAAGPSEFSESIKYFQETNDLLNEEIMKIS